MHIFAMFFSLIDIVEKPIYRWRRGGHSNLSNGQAMDGEFQHNEDTGGTRETYVLSCFRRFSTSINELTLPSGVSKLRRRKSRSMKRFRRNELCEYPHERIIIERDLSLGDWATSSRDLWSATNFACVVFVMDLVTRLITAVRGPGGTVPRKGTVRIMRRAGTVTSGARVCCCWKGRKNDDECNEKRACFEGEERRHSATMLVLAGESSAARR